MRRPPNRLLDTIPAFMHPIDIAFRRLYAQRLEGEPAASPAGVVGWLGAVQAQDYGPAKWSLGERGAGFTDADVDQALADGALLRTHLLRQTWHFVLPADIRWMQALTAPRVHALNAYYYRQSGLEDGVRERATRLIVGALRGGNMLTRTEVAAVLARDGIHLQGPALAFALMQAELDCVVVSGALRGRQHTYALLDERVPETPPRERDEALGELALRYFTSRGPATAKDLRFWCSLPLADIQRGIEVAGDRLVREEADGLVFWSASAEPPPAVPSPKVHLLQGLDEYFVGYGESRAYCDQAGDRRELVDRAIYNGGLIVDSQLAGHWKRAVSKRNVTVTAALRDAFDAARLEALQVAADRLGVFLGVPAVVETSVL